MVSARLGNSGNVSSQSLAFFLKLFLKMLVDKGISSEVLNNFKAEKSISVKEKYIDN